MSNQHRGSQSFLSITIGASRYSLRKAIVKQVHVDQNWVNIWGGFPPKRQCDVFNEKDCNLIKDQWDTTTTISPNRKDVKRKRINTKTFEQHAIHYL
jgi:hypothetical protein